MSGDCRDQETAFFWHLILVLFFLVKKKTAWAVRNVVLLLLAG